MSADADQLFKQGMSAQYEEHDLQKANELYEKAAKAWEESGDHKSADSARRLIAINKEKRNGN